MADDGPLDAMTTQVGFMNALRTGNIVLDMILCMIVPIIFGGIGSVFRETLPLVRRRSLPSTARSRRALLA